MPITDTLARNRITNVLHFEHITGGISDGVLEDISGDILELYQTRYGRADREIMVKAYDTDAVPNYPRATVVASSGVAWTQSFPRELALCLSFAAHNRGNKSERGRIYLNPFIALTAGSAGLRPTDAQLQWVLDFYTVPNASLPDIGGVDWKFGTYSPTYKKFTQSTQAWCNDDWDVMRSRGLRESKRLSVNRDG
jgi:hypothetical protein